MEDKHHLENCCIEEDMTEEIVQDLGDRQATMVLESDCKDLEPADILNHDMREPLKFRQCKGRSKTGKTCFFSFFLPPQKCSFQRD